MPKIQFHNSNAMGKSDSQAASNIGINAFLGILNTRINRIRAAPKLWKMSLQVV